LVTVGEAKKVICQGTAKVAELLQASIIIPTYNRASCLSICLEALASQTMDETAFEIIIVDNNSLDNTREVVLDFAQSQPTLHVRYVFEPRQGVCHARNRGIAKARGEILCFLDDDAVPSPGWLNALLEGFADPTVGCVGGAAILDYQGRKRPLWLHGDLQGLLSGYKLPYTQPTPVSSVDEFPFGCNVAFRGSVLAELGLFRADLGRSGGSSLAGEETELIGRFHKAGWKVVYLPDAAVRHMVAPERLKKSYIYRIGWGLAASHVILTYDPRLHMVVRWFASDLWYATRMLFKLVAAILWRKPLWFDDYMRFWIVANRIPIRIKMLLEGSTFSQVR
jgi:glycosyltransferase involved in cell wall biosynthesis